MLTQLRSCGYIFNPVTIYICKGLKGELEAIVAEITNTPWGEKHAYVLDARTQSGKSTKSWTFNKTFHVSPFHPMEHVYHWSIQLRDQRIAISMVNRHDDCRVFDATLIGNLSPLTRKGLFKQAWKSPFQSQKMHLAIYWHALCLLLKRARFHIHPAKRDSE